MKDRWMWNPETERILDMKHRKSYSRQDFKEIFKILVRTERRKEDLRKMASFSEKERLKVGKTCEEKIKNSRCIWRDELRGIEIKNDALKKKINGLTIEVFFHKERKNSIVKIIEECDTKEEILEECKRLHLIEEEKK